MSPSLTPSPTPAPPTAAQVLEWVNDAGFEGSFEFTGTTALAPDGPASDVSGTYTKSRTGAEWSVRIEAPDGTVREIEALEYRGVRYVRGVNELPWFEAPRPYAGDELANGLRSLETLEANGSDLVGGKETWKFTSRDDAIAVAIPGVTDGAAELTGFFGLGATRMGEVTWMGLTEVWKATASDGSPEVRTVVLKFTLTGRPSSTTAAPDLVWSRFVSEHLGYTIGMPADVPTHEGSGREGDVFGFGNGEFIVVVREEQLPGATLDDYVNAFVEATEGSDQTFDGRGSMSINDCTFPVLGYTGDQDGVPFVYRYALTLVDHVGYTIGFAVRAENAEVLDDFVPTVICTFQVTATG